ncbi:hypothetical protein AAMO2058_000882000 [Amorphochlora amoebiformis]
MATSLPLVVASLVLFVIPATAYGPSRSSISCSAKGQMRVANFGMNQGRRAFASGLIGTIALKSFIPRTSRADPIPGGPPISEEYIQSLKKKKSERCKYKGGCPDSGRIFQERGYVEYFHTLNKEFVRNLDGSYDIVDMKDARELQKNGKLRSEKIGYLPFGDGEILVRTE